MPTTTVASAPMPTTRTWVLARECGRDGATRSREADELVGLLELFLVASCRHGVGITEGLPEITGAGHRLVKCGRARPAFLYIRAGT